MTEQRKIVEFGGTKFYLEQRSPTYTVLVPVDDPDWILRHCEIVAPRSKNDD